MTAVRDPDAAWQVLVEDALEAAALIRELAAGRGRRRRVGRRQPRHPDRDRARPSGDAARGHGDEVPVPGAGGRCARGAVHRRPRPVGGVRPRRGPRPLRACAGPRPRPAAGRGRARAAPGGRRRRRHPVDGRRCRRGRARAHSGARGGLRGGRRTASTDAAASSSFASTTPLRSGFRAVPGSLVRVRSCRYHRSQHELPRVRACEPEGRRRKDHDRDQHGRMRRRGGHTRAPDRPRSAGQRHDRPGIPARRARGEHL